MKIKIDENISASLCRIFAEHGHEADTVFSEGIGGCSDEIIYQRSIAEKRILVTCDLDFADIRRFSPSASGGIVVLRLSNRSSKAVQQRISTLLQTIDISELQGAITIVSDDRIRMRR